MSSPLILVIEDNPRTRKMVRAALQAEGWQVREMGDDATALAELDIIRPDLIIQDLHLPDFDGIALMRALRARPAAARIPILAFSGLLSKIEEARLVPDGFTDYLLKPVDVARLLEVVQGHLRLAAFATAHAGGQRTVLLVDDDVVRRETTREYLTHADFAVMVAQDVPGALRVARERRPAIIVTSLVLASASGMELSLAIRRDPELAGVPCLVCSPFQIPLEEADQEAARVMGANAMLSRSEGIGSLIEAIERALAEPPPVAPVGDTDRQHAEYFGRLLHQLERQTRLNSALLRRSATDSALISIMSVTADTLTRAPKVEGVLEEVLARALDAGGVSAGAIYFFEPTGTTLEAQIGFDSLGTVGSFFGHEDFLHRIAAAGLPREIDAQDPSEEARAILRSLRTPALIVAPILADGRPQGALVLQGSTRELGPTFLASASTMANQLGLAIALARAVERVNSTEQRYRMLVERVPVGLFRCAADGTFIDANPEFSRMLGHAYPAETVGGHARVLFPDEETFRAWSATLMAEGQQRDTDVRILHRDGLERFAVLSARAVDPDHAPCAWEGTVTDITQRRQAGRRLQAQFAVSRVIAEARSLHEGLTGVLGTLAEGLEASFGALWMPDATGDQMVAVETWPPNLATSAFAEATRARPFARGMGMVGRTWDTGRVLTVADVVEEPGFLRSEAARLDGLHGALWIPIHQGEDVVGVLELLSDTREMHTPELDTALDTIAGQVRQWCERIKVIESLHTTQNHLTRILGTARAVLYVLRPEGGAWVPEWVSDNIERMTGFPPAEALQPSWWADHLHPDERERVLATDGAVDSAGRVYRFRCRDGHYIWLRDTQETLREGDAPGLRIVGAWMDVTEMKELEAQFMQAQKMEGIGRVTAGVAHDFNNMLTAITGNAEMLREEIPANSPSQECVTEVLEAARRARDLTRQLLAFSRRQELRPVVTDLNAIIRGIHPMLARVLGSQVALVLTLGEALPPILADPGPIEQILLNLVVNSRDAMPDGGTIEIGTRASERGAIVWVRDTGSGMSPHLLTRIFEPFFTTKEAGKGTGLGLSTVYGIVQQSGGTIDVESTPGVGTTFTICFPEGMTATEA